MYELLVVVSEICCEVLELVSGAEVVDELSLETRLRLGCTVDSPD